MASRSATTTDMMQRPLTLFVLLSSVVCLTLSSETCEIQEGISDLIGALGDSHCLCNDREVTEQRIRKWIDNLGNFYSLGQAEKTQRTTTLLKNPSSSLAQCYSKDEVSGIFATSLTEEEGEKKLNDIFELRDGTTGSIVFTDGSELQVGEGGLEEGKFAPAAGSSASVHVSDGISTLSFVSDGISACIVGRVTGFDRLSGLPVTAAWFDPATALPVGPLWHVVYSMYDNALVGVLYKEEMAGMANNTQNYFRTKSQPFHLSGDDVTFIYPDFRTAVRGSFSTGGTLILGQQVDITGALADSEIGGILRLEFSSPYGPTFYRDVSTRSHLSSWPLLRDPYEGTLVDVRESSVAGAGQGVFLKQAAKNQTIVAYFNGIRLREKEVFGDIGIRKSVYLVEIGDDDDFLDVPKESANWNVYAASSGHKINHAKDGNGDYSECQHPRFGRILCFFLNRDLPAGSELFTRYDVAFDRQQMKDMLKTFLNVGHWFSGKSKKEFVEDVRPYLEAASKMAGSIKMEDLVRF